MVVFPDGTMISPESQSSFVFQVLLVLLQMLQANCEDDIKVECLWCVDWFYCVFLDLDE